MPLVSEFVRPRNVIDVGCGVGTWLAFWKKIFGAESYGIDGDYVDRSQLLIDAENFHPANLEERITSDKRFDLAMSLEVAEHLTPAQIARILSQAPRHHDFGRRAPRTVDWQALGISKRIYSTAQCL